MLFNSIEFALFFPSVFLIYWGLNRFSLRWQNTFIVIVSYFFYGWWDIRFLSLIAFSTLVDFTAGYYLGKTAKSSIRKLWLALSIVTNLGLLGFFKYYNFFIDNLNATFSFFGKPINVSTLNIILPVGISFYTFQTLSYTIDVYRKKMDPTKDVIVFAAFVSFFPQLVAGPIERASHLLPQFYSKRPFNYLLATDGLRQILWGLFKKIVIADNCAFFVNQIFGNYQDLNGSALVLGAILFSFQIYGDFSGYSDIAIGTSRLLGFDLMQNFAYPYFSRNMGEFYRRWHISLTTWFRDYVYIPLGGSYSNKVRTLINTFLIFLLSGFWHGANWTFIVWGLLNAIYFLPLLLTKTNRKYTTIAGHGRIWPTLSEFFSMLITFMLATLSRVFFRSPSITDAVNYLSGMASTSLFEIPFVGDRVRLAVLVITIIIFIAIEWQGREQPYALQAFGLRWRKPFRYAFYYLIILFVFGFGGEPQTFIYFNF